MSFHRAAMGEIVNTSSHHIYQPMTAMPPPHLASSCYPHCQQTSPSVAQFHLPNNKHSTQLTSRPTASHLCNVQYYRCLYPRVETVL